MRWQAAIRRPKGIHMPVSPLCVHSGPGYNHRPYGNREVEQDKALHQLQAHLRWGGLTREADL